MLMIYNYAVFCWLLLVTTLANASKLLLYMFKLRPQALCCFYAKHCLIIVTDILKCIKQYWMLDAVSMSKAWHWFEIILSHSIAAYAEKHDHCIYKQGHFQYPHTFGRLSNSYNTYLYKRDMSLLYHGRDQTQVVLQAGKTHCLSSFDVPVKRKSRDMYANKFPLHSN